VFKFLDAIRPKTLADKVKDILRMKEMDPNSWTVKDVGDIAIRLEKAQGEETLWTTTKPVVVGSGVSNGGGFVKSSALTCYKCGRIGHVKQFCPMKTSKPIKKAVTDARSSFGNPKANRSDERKCYTCNRPGHLAKECPRNKGKISNQTTQVKGKPWCSYHKLNSHSSETCWALHPELRPSSSKERAAQSARQAKVVPAKAGHSLNDKLKSALLPTMKATQSGVSQTMDSYYAEQVFNGDTNDLAEFFTVTAGAATKERRSGDPGPTACYPG
jgi:hypothetical protein